MKPLLLLALAAAYGCGDDGTGLDMALADMASLSTDALLPRTLVFREEFDGPAGQAPNPATWNIEVGGNGFGNMELEYMTARPSNVALDGAGHLVITAQQEPYNGHQYTSGRINTAGHFAKMYGRFEARMQLPTGQGLWPAFWLLGNNDSTVGWPACGEVDILESKGQAPAIIHGSMHGPGYSGGHAVTSTYAVAGGGLDRNFHVYAVEWSVGRMEFSIDDIVYFTVTPAQLPSGTKWVFDHPFFVIFDVAVGGNYVGAPNGTTSFPQTLLVDWVHVYEALQ
jgi:beta-glucanase (GH16 family)